MDRVHTQALLASDRQHAILELVRKHGWVRIGELTSEFGVSDMTIRRDLLELAQRGVLLKVHGGARSIGSVSRNEPGFDAKQVVMADAKAQIARRAARLIQSGQTIGLSAGTTTYALAREIRAIDDLTVITNSIPVAQIFYDDPRPGRTVLLTGGERTPSNALVGSIAIHSLTGLNLDFVFLGVHGIDERSGFTCPNLLEAETNRQLIETAQQLVVLADHTKWGTVGLVSVAPLDRADAIVLDAATSPETRAALEASISEVIVAGETD